MKMKLLCCTALLACTMPLAAQCVYNFGNSFTAAGGNGSTYISATTNCSWTVTGMPSWITLTTSVPVTNSGTVSYTVAANTTTNIRTSTLTVAGLSYVVSQALDVTPPTVPTLTATATSTTTISLSWTTSTDSGGSGLAGYKVYRAGVLITNVTGTTYSDTGLTANTQYCYTVAAYDNAGSTSAQSASQCATTPSGGAPLGWVKRYGSTLSDVASNVAIDGSGNIITAGAFTGTVTFGPTVLTSTGTARDMFLMKQSPDGTVQWAKKFGSTGTEFVKAIVLDASGNIYLGGWFTGAGTFGGSVVTSTGGYDSFLAKYQTDGTFVWQRTWGGIKGDVVNSITLDAAKTNLIVTGYFQGTVVFTPTTTLNSVNSDSDTFLGKYSTATGAPVWVRSFSNLDIDMGLAVMVDSSDNVFLAGQFNLSINLGSGSIHTAGTTYNRDIYIAKYAASGTNAPTVPLWAFQRGTNTSESLFAGALDTSGNVFLIGTFSGQRTDLGGGSITGQGINSDLFVVKYSGANGAFLWARPMLCVSGGAPRALGFDSSSHVIVGGYYYGTCNFGAQSFTSAGSWDVFAAKYNGSTGAPIWAKTFGGTGGEDCYGLAVEASNFTVMVGTFDGSANFGGTMLTSAGYGDAFVMRLVP